MPAPVFDDELPDASHSFVSAIWRGYIVDVQGEKCGDTEGLVREHRGGAPIQGPL